jgi:exodeoxyribonuclease VII small subunit
MSKAKNKDEALTFEQAVVELGAIIERIESGQAGLEESLGQYEKGMKLIGQCRSILTAAEQRIAELSVDSQGKLRMEAGGADGGPSAEASGGESGGDPGTP